MSKNHQFFEQLLEEESVVDNYVLDYNHKSKGREKTAQKCPHCNQYIYQNIERIYDGEEGRLKALDDMMEKYKAQLGPLLATNIVESHKSLPPLVIKLFDKIRVLLMCKIKLSPKQQEIATLKEGAFLVRASDGSNKTGIVVERIKMLAPIAEMKVLILTSTSKARDEIRKGIVGLEEELLDSVLITTFRDLCESIIRSRITLTRFKTMPQIFTEDDRKKILEETITDNPSLRKWYAELTEKEHKEVLSKVLENISLIKRSVILDDKP